MHNLAPIPAAFASGQVDSTSTATAFTAQIPGISAYYHGLSVFLKNGVVTSAAGFTININGLGAKPSYSNMAAATADTTIFNINYTMLFVYDENRVSGGCWVCYRGYNSDTNTIAYSIRTVNSTLPLSDKCYRYRILFTSADGTKWVPSNDSTSTSGTAAKTVNQRPIDPFGTIAYYSNTTAYAAGNNMPTSYQWRQYSGIVFGYAFNRTGAALTLSYPAPVYIKCAPQTDGSAIIDADTPYVQALPSTEDGKIYIFLGYAYDATHIELTYNHPVYCYKNGHLLIWTAADDNDPKVEQTAATTSSYSYWRSLLVGASSNVNEGQAPTTVTDKTYAFETLQVQPSTGTFRGNNYALAKGNYKTTLTPATLTADRTITVPDKTGTLALTSDIPASPLPAVTSSDNGKVLMVVNGVWSAESLPVYNGGVS
ncbi:MAG: hypothetical protein LIR46_04435 [Bacteroidota bacterium]|nr:hypothetical protein [Bacteroidota bacterium]